MAGSAGLHAFTELPSTAATESLKHFQIRASPKLPTRIQLPTDSNPTWAGHGNLSLLSLQAPSHASAASTGGASSSAMIGKSSDSAKGRRLMGLIDLISAQTPIMLPHNWNYIAGCFEVRFCMLSLCRSIAIWNCVKCFLSRCGSSISISFWLNSQFLGFLTHRAVLGPW